jgi:L-iditol 2-dehydrogenase
MGHETAGVVAEVGEGVEGIAVGDRVALEPLHGCRELDRDPCPMCQIDHYALCKGLSIVGVPIGTMIPGGFGEYSLYHGTRVFKLPDNVSFEEASLLDTLACTVHAINLGKPLPGEVVAVVGCGIIGIDTIQCLKAAGAKNILAVAKYEWQGEIARRYGATDVILGGEGRDTAAAAMRLTEGWGVDQVYECVGGETDALQESLAMVRPGGKVIMEGFFSGSRPLDLVMLLLRESPIIPSMCYSYYGDKREFKIALDMVARGAAEQTSMITHRFPVESWREAIQTAIDKKANNAIKVMFEF